jgi:hypothetical protein
VDCLSTLLAHAIHIVSHSQQSLPYPGSSPLELLQQHTVKLLTRDRGIALTKAIVRPVGQGDFQRGDLGLDPIQFRS